MFSKATSYYSTLAYFLRYYNIYCLTSISVEPPNTIKNTKFWQLYHFIGNSTYWVLLVVIVFRNVVPDNQFMMREFSMGAEYFYFFGGIEIVLTIARCALVTWIFRSHNDTHKEIYSSLNEFDRILIENFDLDMKYRQTAYRSLAAVYIIVLQMTVSPYFYLNYFLGPELKNVPFVVVHSVANTFWSLERYAFAQICSMTRERLNKIAEVLKMIEKCEDDEKKAKSLEIVFDCCERLCTVVDLTNKMFGILNVTAFFHDFTFSSTMSFFIYFSLDNTVKWNIIRPILGVTFPNIGRIIVVTANCHIVKVKFQNVVRIGQRMADQKFSGDLYEIVKNFICQNHHRRVYYHSNYYFTIDLTLLYSMVSAIATYLLMLIQFKMYQDERRGAIK